MLEFPFVFLVVRGRELSVFLYNGVILEIRSPGEVYGWVGDV